MDTLLLYKLLVAHIIADFPLQPASLCNMKQSKGWKRFSGLFLHSLIHATVTYILIWNFKEWIIPAVIFASHFILDWIKVMLNKKSKDNPGKERNIFIIDQLLHLLIIAVLWIIISGNGRMISEFLQNSLSESRIWIVIISYILVLQPTSILLQLIIRKWNTLEKDAIEKKGELTLPSAGKYIGYLERLLILTFVISNNLSAVGFLLAAKSIFRFGELKEQNDIRFTEYVLTGTLMSFAFAIFIGILTLKLIS